MRPVPTTTLTEWIAFAGNECREIQGLLDRHAQSAVDISGLSQQELRAVGRVLQTIPPTRQVVRSLELKVQVQIQDSRTLGFRVEAGTRLGQDFVGLAYERSRTLTRSADTTFTVSVVPVPDYAGRSVPRTSRES